MSCRCDQISNTALKSSSVLSTVVAFNKVLRLMFPFPSRYPNRRLETQLRRFRSSVTFDLPYSPLLKWLALSLRIERCTISDEAAVVLGSHRC